MAKEDVIGTLRTQGGVIIDDDDFELLCTFLDPYNIKKGDPKHLVSTAPLVAMADKQNTLTALRAKVG